VLLRHEQPDGGVHFDWLIDVAPDQPLLTFRLPHPPDQAPCDDGMAIERSRDHRRVYLTFEGSLDGNRGNVHRVSRGRVRWCEVTDDEWIAEVQWDPGSSSPRQMRFRHRESRSWTLAC
jgi:hypothetical protein